MKCLSINFAIGSCRPDLGPEIALQQQQQQLLLLQQQQPAAAQDPLSHQHHRRPNQPSRLRHHHQGWWDMGKLLTQWCFLVRIGFGNVNMAPSCTINEEIRHIIHICTKTLGASMRLIKVWNLAWFSHLYDRGQQIVNFVPRVPGCHFVPGPNKLSRSKYWGKWVVCTCWTCLSCSALWLVKQSAFYLSLMDCLPCSISTIRLVRQHIIINYYALLFWVVFVSGQKAFIMKSRWQDCN